METSNLVRRALVTGAVALATLATAAGCFGGAQGPRGFNDADVGFAQAMISHYGQAAEMATLADTRAADPEIKQIAAQVKQAGSQEVTTLTTWLQARGMPTADGGTGMAGMPGMASEQEMAQLTAATGVEFDRMFARMLIAHHNGGIQACREIKGAGLNPEVIALATTMETTQTSEVAALQKILDRL